VDFLPIPLHRKHENNPNMASAQSIHPRDRLLIDLVSAFSGDAHSYVYHSVDGVTVKIPVAGRYHLKVTVTAQDTPMESAWFDVWMDKATGLQCEKMEGKASN
jgi:hypothetical protein